MGDLAFSLRAAEPRDLASLVGLITGLAEYERLTHQLEVTEERLGLHLFGERPAAEAIIAEDASGRALGFALFFSNYSTFIGKPGLHLEDLFVVPEARGHGVGGALIREVGRIAVARDCARFEWTVLDWNEPAIELYKALGADILPDWRVCRVSGEALARFGRKQ
jgi:GNAT superfamily N-acetyltransferase